MTRKEALAILAHHNMKPSISEEYNPDGSRHLPGSFDNTFGIRKTYSTKAVWQWLGY